MIYYHVRFPRTDLSTELEGIAAEWSRQYDLVYLLDTAQAVYREDGHRAPSNSNTWRETCRTLFSDTLESVVHEDKLIFVGEETYRESAEWVYHDILSRCLAETRPKRAYQQVRQWLASRGHRVLEVRPQGSNSITRFHAPSDNDDIDMMVVVDGDADYAIEVRKDFLLHKEHLENIVQADLDVLITPHGMEAHEV